MNDNSEIILVVVIILLLLSGIIISSKYLETQRQINLCEKYSDYGYISEIISYKDYTIDMCVIYMKDGTRMLADDLIITDRKEPMVKQNE